MDFAFREAEISVSWVLTYHSWFVASLPCLSYAHLARGARAEFYIIGRLGLDWLDFRLHFQLPNLDHGGGVTRHGAIWCLKDDVPLCTSTAANCSTSEDPRRVIRGLYSQNKNPQNCPTSVTRLFYLSHLKSATMVKPPTGPPPPTVPEGWKAHWNDDYKTW